MSKKIIVVGVIIIVLIAMTSVFVIISINNTKSNANSMMHDEVSYPVSFPLLNKVDDKMMHDDSKMNKISGTYIPYDISKLTLQKNVIFFAASWCPTCQALNKSINNNLTSIPSNLTILKADYDSEVQLKQKYGITYQHTLVQVDQNGNILKKWSGSYSIDDIINQLV